MQNKENNIDIFISHSSQDADIAKALIALLRSALNLHSKSIRCTSVDGYMFESGTQIGEQIRREVHESKVFIGLITPQSIKSSYVLFELAARWGAGLELFPLLAAGAEARLLPPPLAERHALQCRSIAQVHQLVGAIAKKMNIGLDNPSAYQKYIEELVAASNINPQQTNAEALQGKGFRSDLVLDNLNEVKEEIGKGLSKRRLTHKHELVTLHSIGGIKDYYPEVVSLIAEARRSIIIVCDYPAYGCVNHSKVWLSYYHTLKSKRMEKVKMTLICPGKDLRAKTDKTEYYSEVWHDWNGWVSKPANKKRVEAFAKALPSYCVGESYRRKIERSINSLKREGFFKLLQQADQLMIDECFEESGVRDIQNLTPIDFWIVDGKRAIIAFSSYARGSRHGFSTTDQELISGFLDIPKYYHC